MNKIIFNYNLILDIKKKITYPDHIILLENFEQGCDNLIATSSLPHILMAHGTKQTREGIGFIIFMFNQLPPNTDPNILESNPKLFEEISKKYEVAKVNIKRDEEDFEFTVQDLEKLKENPKLNLAINSLYLSIISNSWTIFESISKDLWVNVLNNFPNELINNVLQDIDSKSHTIEGIHSSNISISLLGKFQFNVKNHLGSILCEKYDFTGCRGIKKAYEKLFCSKNQGFDFLDETNMILLEKTRHLVVHQAGKIDERFQKETSINQSIGTVLNIELEEVTKYINLIIKNGANLFENVNNKIEKFCR
jgi:hypothetical protein